MVLAKGSCLSDNRMGFNTAKCGQFVICVDCADYRVEYRILSIIHSISRLQ